jgi:hypothetical protein
VVEVIDRCPFGQPRCLSCYAIKTMGSSPFLMSYPVAQPACFARLPRPF